MRLVERTPIATADPVSVTDLADHLRVEFVEAASAMRYARAAAAELERYVAIALLTQTIVAESIDTPDTIVSLPIGPVATTTIPTVELLAEDHTATAITTGWHLAHGRFPELHFDAAPEGRLRITYTAGFGLTDASLPRDLSLAILDQALRLYDLRGDADTSPRLAPSAARICARYRRVSV